MKKRFRKLDAIAATLLFGTAGVMALAQVEDPPFPLYRTCPAGTYTFADGVQGQYPSWNCPWGTSCHVVGFILLGNYYIVRDCLVTA